MISKFLRVFLTIIVCVGLLLPSISNANPPRQDQENRQDSRGSDHSQRDNRNHKQNDRGRDSRTDDRRGSRQHDRGHNDRGHNSKGHNDRGHNSKDHNDRGQGDDRSSASNSSREERLQR